MAWGKSNEAWNRTASIMALLAGIHWDKDSGTPQPTVATYHPFMPEPELPTASPDVLRAITAAMRRQRPEVPNGG
jgi:hypothetical protein